LKSDFEINEITNIKFQLATGNDDPVSTNETLTGYFTSKPIILDQAYAKIAPEMALTPVLQLGKFGVPFYKAGGNQLIWDGDLNIEGVSLGLAQGMGNGLSLNVTGGNFWTKENSPINRAPGVATVSAKNGTLEGVQAYFKWKGSLIGQKAEMVLGGGYLNYEQIEGTAPLGSSFGNTDKAGKLVFDYELVEAFAEYKTGFAAGTGLKFFGQYVKNNGVNTGRYAAAFGPGSNFNPNDWNEGWLAGAELKSGGLFETKDLISAKYRYAELESDAVLAGLANSNFNGGGTSGKPQGRGHALGSILSVGYKLLDGVDLSWTFIHTNSGRKYERNQVDLVVAFK
jgi:hypothetical protein